mgnify:CR=1 FL=1
MAAVNVVGLLAIVGVGWALSTNILIAVGAVFAVGAFLIYINIRMTGR